MTTDSKPNLNLIGRLWKPMRKHTANNRAHATFREFREEPLMFFVRPPEESSAQLRSPPTLRFSIVSDASERKQTIA